MLSATQVDVSTTGEQISAQLVTLTEKYLGNNLFALSGTNAGYIGAQITAMAPWGNLANRYFPTVATLPQSGNNIVTKDQLGYFTPNNLGVSTYLTKNITSLINSNEINPGSIHVYADSTKFNKGRGLTENEQENIITHIENLDWMKSIGTETEFDGQVIGSDNYQKFIPYQSNYETTKTDSNGVVTIKDDFEFWTGTRKDVWLTNNKLTEEDWLKYHDLELRVRNLLITPDKELYAWQTDVYGNQYALYKAVPEGGRTIYNMQNAYGELWVKTIDGTIYPATSALTIIIEKYVNEPVLYTQLKANSIKNIEIFFDTLVIELSGHTIYEKITFDYDTSTIGSYGVDFLSLDYNQQVSTRLLSSLSLISSLSAAGITNATVGSLADVYYGGHWYDEKHKKFTACLLLSANITTVGSASGLIVPVLYEYDINKPGSRERIYPTNTTDYSLFVYGASAITYIEPPVITYNSDASTYCICFIGYINQYFNVICYNTRETLIGKVLTNEVKIPIVTETGNTILTV